MQSLTTGEIAKFCGVTLRTVIRWLETDKLKGFKLPGRGNNRILVDDFIFFLRQHKMPIPQELTRDELRILIVDDEMSMAKAIQRVARRAGLKTLIANGGFQAGLMLSMHKPALMTLDLNMPSLNGFDVIRFTREQKELNETKIIVISALDDTQLHDAVQLGANKAFPKPFDQSQLMAEFEAAIP
ncbi:response regulator [Aliiglaciecola sp.]|nr:response regulator [Aliiglaciecola sp.]